MLCSSLAGSSVASAEIVFLTSGARLSVKSHANDGDSIVLDAAVGRGSHLDKTLIEKIVPDEVPHPEPAPPAPEPVAAPPAAPRGALLKETAYPG